MLKIDNRESAHVRSRVKDLSKVPNTVGYTGLFACLTPLSTVASTTNSDGEAVYTPVLVRDVDTLISTFGDPRIDLEKYADLYSIMQVINSGGTCYVAKVDSGTPGEYQLHFPNTVDQALTLTKGSDNSYSMSDLPYNTYPLTVTDDNDTELDKDNYTSVCSYNSDTEKYTLTINYTVAADGEQPSSLKVTEYTDSAFLINANSLLTDSITITSKLVQNKPLSLKSFYLVTTVTQTVDGELVTLGTAKVKLDLTTTNQNIVDSLNSALSTYVSFELQDSEYASACIGNDTRAHSIVHQLFVDNGIISASDSNLANPNLVILASPYEVSLSEQIPITEPEFEVTLDDYKNALNQYKDRKYAGCLLADLTAPVTKNTESDTDTTTIKELSCENRRSLHFYLKQIACERKDCTVVLSTPYTDDNDNVLSLDGACDWVSSNGDYNTYWEYGHSNTTNYDEQSFYLEMYYSWLNLAVKTTGTDLSTHTQEVIVAPSNAVINNILTSYRERGVQYPVAGDQYGTLASTYTIINNPATKANRDQLVSYRINPIYDTGTRGVQIYGNETLNADYTDLSAAHIARDLVNIRSRIDEYTETLKFSINNAMLWDKWKNYVSTYILEPLKSENALSDYTVAMGMDTTTAEDIANRTIRGNISLIFYQSAEIFDLSFTVYSSATATTE